MSAASWNSFTYYRTGDIVEYLGIEYRCVLPNIDVVPTALAPDWAYVNPPAPQQVNTLNNIFGYLTLTSSQATFTPNDVTNTIDMAITNYPTNVSSLNSLSGSVSITSPDSSITVGAVGNAITLANANTNKVSSLNTLTGAVTLTSNPSIVITPSGQNINLQLGTLSGVVTSLNGVENAAVLTSPDSTVVINAVGQNIELSGPNVAPPLYLTTPNATSAYVWLYQNLTTQSINGGIPLGNGTFLTWPDSLTVCSLYPNPISNRDFPSSQDFQWLTPLTGVYAITINYAIAIGGGSIAYPNGIIAMVVTPSTSTRTQVYSLLNINNFTQTFTVGLTTDQYLMFLGGPIGGYGGTISDIQMQIQLIATF